MTDSKDDTSFQENVARSLRVSRLLWQNALKNNVQFWTDVLKLQSSYIRAMMSNEHKKKKDKTR